MRPILRALNRPAVALAAVLAIAGGLRFYHLGQPDSYVFDEVYYAKDACLYQGYGRFGCDLEGKSVYTTPLEQTWVHPPLGKWMIVLGELPFGHDAFGWRAAAAAFGTLTAVLVAVMALVLFRSALWAFLAGLLLATEHLHFVQSRISMLDVFLGFWVVLGFLCLVLDRRWIERRTLARWAERARERPPPAATEPLPDIQPSPSLGPGAMSIDEPLPGAATETDTEERPRADADDDLPGWVPSPLWRPWRFAAGVALGAGVATKWSGLFALLGAILLAAVWERTRRVEGGVDHPIADAIVQESFGILLALLLVPIATYLASYAGFFIEWSRDRGWWGSVVEFWRRQQGMFDFHFHLDAIKEGGEPSHPYMSRPWTWILLKRPVAYFFESPGTEILGIGNPAIFWVNLMALPYLAWAWWGRKRDRVAGMILVAVLFQYGPWLAFGRPQFLFYMTPVVPFMVLAFAYFCRDLSEMRLAGSRSRPYLPVAVGLLTAAVAIFVFFWPVLTAYPLSKDAWNLRIWVSSWV